jgi:ribosomal protein S18 acetylase RimI-like enzyme
MDPALIDGVRRFNRTVTQSTGALDDAFLSRARPLGQARLLWLLRALEQDGLAVVGVTGDDGRVRTVRLTTAGMAERAELDRRSDAAAAAGCGVLKFHRDAPAEIKRMWVAPQARGLGLGRRLLAELEAHAAACGVRTLRLETNRSLGEAISLYASAGFREVAPFNDEPYAHHWFSKTLPA